MASSTQRDIVENIVAKDSTKSGTDSAGKNFDKLKAKVDAAGKSGSGLGAKFKSGVSGVAAVTNKMALGFVAFGGYAIKSASDAQQSLGATQTIFGKTADQIIAKSNQAATQYGLSANQYRESANLIGSLFKNQGVSSDKLAGQTDKMIAKASDLAAVFGGPTSDAVDALSSAFKGEFDPLERYGITLNQTTINTEAMRLAHVKTTAAFNKLSPAQQKAYQQQAALSLINKQSADSTGQFAAQTNTSAEKLQIVKAQFDNTAATVGTKLLPIVNKLLEWANKFIDWAAKHQVIVAAFAAFTAAIWLLNAALDANPITLILIGIAALVAGVIYAYTHFKTFRDIVNAVWGFMKGVAAWFAGPFAGAFVTAFNAVKTAVVAVKNAFVTAWNAVKSGATSAWNWVKDRANDVVGFFKGLPHKMASAVSGLWNGVKDGFRSAINWVIDRWNNFHIPAVKILGHQVTPAINFPDLPRLALGGPVRGGSYLVGERGPEILNLGPGASGRVIPNNQIGGGGDVVVHVYIGDRELTDIVRVEVDESNRATRRRVLAGAG